jgi:hypothetical protein
MPQGRQSKVLRADYIKRLKRFQTAERLSLPQLKLAMGAPFTWSTLARALRGQPIWELSYAYIVQWLDRYAPEKPLHDGKSAAAGDGKNTDEAAGEGRSERKDEETEPEAGTTGTVRGSR